MSYSASARTNSKLMTGDAGVDARHVGCAPCEEIIILSQTDYELSTSELWDHYAKLEALRQVVPKKDQL